MNRTYRSVWGQALGAWGAASEFAGRRRKGARPGAIGVAALLTAAAMGAAQAQVKIGDNPTTINPGSVLEVESTNRGVSMPRVALTDRATWTLNGNQPVDGMMVYNTNATTGVDGLQAGMAVWKGGQWVSVDETPYLHVNSTAVGNSTLANSGATGADAIAIGPQTVVNGNNGIGMGNGATVQASAPGGIAIGQASTSGAADAVALGTQASANAVQGVALGAGSSVTQVGGVALGAGSVASTASGVAGYIPPTATAEQRTAIGATTSTLSAVSVGDAASGQFRQITGVAAGTVDSDAVNVSQLRAVQGQVTQIDQGSVKYDTNVDGTPNYNSLTMGGGNATGPVTVHNVGEGVAGTDAVNVNQLNGATSKLDNRIDGLADQVSANTRMLSGGIAASAAMAVVTPVEPGRYHVSGAVAGYNGQAGIGFNLLKRSDNGQTTLHAGVGWGSGGSKAIVRVGFGLSFD